VRGEVRITLPPQDAGHETAFVLGDWMTLDQTSAPGATVRVEPTDQPFKGLNRIAFSFAKAPTAPVTLVFRYHGPLHAADDKPLIDPKEGIELPFESAWAPVRPNFNLVFTADADITGIPADEVVVAQGQVKHVGDRLRIHRSFEDLDMPFAALIGLIASRQTHSEVYARHPDGVLETVYRKQAEPILDYYTSLYGPPPPGALPVRLVVLPRQSAAYERRAYVSIPDGAEELKKAGHYEEWMLPGTVAHEFAHNWWWRGDPLSEDNWLNESMAEYSSMRFIGATYGQAALDKRLAIKRERVRNAGPMIGHGRPSSTLAYQKGPVLLFDLQAKIGQAKMDEFLGRIGRAPPRTTPQFLTALAQVAGPEAAKDFEATLRAP
jgi:hypothetical protein